MPLFCCLFHSRLTVGRYLATTGLLLVSAEELAAPVDVLLQHDRGRIGLDLLHTAGVELLGVHGGHELLGVEGHNRLGDNHVLNSHPLNDVSLDHYRAAHNDVAADDGLRVCGEAGQQGEGDEGGS